jgi:hypothetical protein
VLGSLKQLTETNGRTQQLVLQDAPKEFKDVQLDCFITADSFGSLALGTFGSSAPNVSVKTFLLDSKDFESVKHDIVTATEAARTLNQWLLTETSNQTADQTTAIQLASTFLPKLLTSFCEPSCFHLVFDTPVISTLEAWSQYQHSTSTGKDELLQSLPYVGSCVVSALEGLHAAGIIYRSVQPEGIHIDAMGRIVLVDYAVSKVGCVGWKTFTLCGVPDYLAPEQLSQRGHNEAVDYWELGLLLYELLARENPFSATNPNELAVMHKITQFGQISFSQLQFPESFPHRLIQLINRLVVPIPEQRLGVMDGGSELLMRQEYFHEIVWSELAQRPSPLREYAEEMRVENLAEGLSSDITEKWQAAEGSSSRIRSATWMEELLRELQ